MRTWPSVAGSRGGANDIVVEIGHELRLLLDDALDPYVLAEWLKIPIIGLSDFADEAPSADDPLSAQCDRRPDSDSTSPEHEDGASSALR